MKIYKLYKILCNDNIIYIGCTSQALSRRLWQHSTDNNSAVYKNYNTSNIEIKEIKIIYQYKNQHINNPSHIIMQRYEEYLTVIYGSKYSLCNINAGNVYYNSMDDSLLYQSCYNLLYDIINETLIIEKSELNNILDILINLSGLQNSKLEDLLDYFSEKICELE